MTGWPASGECVIQGSDYDPVGHRWGSLTVLTADPLIEIDGQFWRGIQQDSSRDHVTVNRDVVTIRATNQTVVYRLLDYDPARDVFLAQWPD